MAKAPPKPSTVPAGVEQKHRLWWRKPRQETPFAEGTLDTPLADLFATFGDEEAAADAAASPLFSADADGVAQTTATSFEDWLQQTSAVRERYIAWMSAVFHFLPAFSHGFLHVSCCLPGVGASVAGASGSLSIGGITLGGGHYHTLEDGSQVFHQDEHRPFQKNIQETRKPQGTTSPKRLVDVQPFAWVWGSASSTGLQGVFDPGRSSQSLGELVGSLAGVA